MSLAYVRQRDVTADAFRFDVDIGRCEFFEYRLAPVTSAAPDPWDGRGFSGPSRRSTLQQRPGDYSQLFPNFVLEVPRRDLELPVWFQIAAFKNADRERAVYSPPLLVEGEETEYDYRGATSAVQPFSVRVKREASMTATAAPQRQRHLAACRSLAFKLRETPEPRNWRQHRLTRAASSPRVALSLKAGPTHTLPTGKRLLFKSGVPLRVRWECRGPSPEELSTAILDVELRDPLAEQKLIRISQPMAGADSIEVTFDGADTEKFPLQRDLELAARLRTGNGPDAELAVAHEDVRFVAKWVLTELGAAGGDATPLRDPAEHRRFWHQIWEGPDNASGFWKLDMECRYYVTLDPFASSSGRMDTRFAGNESPEERTGQLTGRMKSGIELAPLELAHLLEKLSPEHAFSPDQLEALACEDLRTLLQSQATSRVRCSGKQGSTGAVWVFPEVELRHVELGEVKAVDRSGLVTELEPHAGLLPVPARLHFVCARTSARQATGEGDGSVQLEGYETLSDQVVRLLPVHLATEEFP